MANEIIIISKRFNISPCEGRTQRHQSSHWSFSDYGLFGDPHTRLRLCVRKGCRPETSVASSTFEIFLGRFFEEAPQLQLGWLETRLSKLIDASTANLRSSLGIGGVCAWAADPHERARACLRCGVCPSNQLHPAGSTPSQM